jgi:hypothetical protein
MPSTPKNLKPNADGCAERKKFRAADFFSSLLKVPENGLLQASGHHTAREPWKILRIRVALGLIDKPSMHSWLRHVAT